MSRPADVFRTLTPEEGQALFRRMREEARPLYRRAEQAASETLRVRPVWLRRQPWPKRCELLRKVLALPASAEEAAEILAGFFLGLCGEDVQELLDALQVEHDGGILRQPPPQPAEDLLRSTVAAFPAAGEDPVLRGVLLKAFAGQAAVDWPLLDEIVFAEGAVAATAS